MRRLAILATSCLLLAACSTRVPRHSDDLWEGLADSDGAAFIGYHGPVERMKMRESD